MLKNLFWYLTNRTLFTSIILIYLNAFLLRIWIRKCRSITWVTAQDRRFFCVKRFCQFNSSPLRTKGVFALELKNESVVLILPWFSSRIIVVGVTRPDAYIFMPGFCMSFNIVVLNTSLQIVQRTLKRTAFAIRVKYESNIMSSFTISQLSLLLKLDCCLCVCLFVCLFVQFVLVIGERKTIVNVCISLYLRCLSRK